MATSALIGEKELRMKSLYVCHDLIRLLRWPGRRSHELRTRRVADRLPPNFIDLFQRLVRTGYRVAALCGEGPRAEIRSSAPVSSCSLRWPGSCPACKAGTSPRRSPLWEPPDPANELGRYRCNRSAGDAVIDRFLSGCAPWSSCDTPVLRATPIRPLSQ